MAQDITTQDSAFVIMSEDEFDTKFNLVEDDDGDVHMTLEDAKGLPSDRVWTWIDGDEGGTYLVSGVQRVNAFAYAVTEESFDPDVSITVIIQGSDDDTEESEGAA